ncbi:MAG: PEP-CTERM sorting domain-containing protein, partial [Akkermansia sp.]|nr:PEP-CTERM sorting domain-containing protein [Akkermansia sp.]
SPSSSSYVTSGGAIYGGSYSTITLSNNGSVTFSGNTASGQYTHGGAIYGDVHSTITLSNNGSVTFSGNTAFASSSYFAASGGAIYTRGDLSIRNNDSVEFYQNAEVENGNTYRLRSIYADGGSDDEISLSAAAGKSITFRDSVYIASGSTVNLNADYTYLDEEGESVTIRQTGDIIFTGATTVDDLYTVKGNVAGTTKEIRLSRTTEVNTLTNLYGGRLRVEEGAIYQGQGITAMKGSGATVRVQNATLSQVGYDLIFNAGTALEVAGNSTIRGNVSLLADSLFKLEQSATLSLHETLQADAATLTVQGTALLTGSSTLNASLTLADGATLDMMSLDTGAVTINGALTLGGQVKMGENLLATVEALTCWEPGLVLFTGLTNLVLPVAASELESDRVLASSVFSNVENPDLYVTYHVVDNVGSLMVMNVPEPTTISLSLAALVALAARRRRR